ILRHNAWFDINMLHWLYGQHNNLMSQGLFNGFAAQALERGGGKVLGHGPAYINAAFSTAHDKVKQLTEVPTFADFYFLPQVELEEASRHDLTADNKRILQALRPALAAHESFGIDSLGGVLKQVAKELGVKIGLVVHPTRLACTGRTVGPSLYHLMEVLGKERVLQRMDRFIEQCP